MKYTKTGGVEIFMAQPGVLCIRDTGVGIRPEDLPLSLIHIYIRPAHLAEALRYRAQNVGEE